MNREETLGKQLLVDEIAQARAYLEGRAPDEQRLAALLKRDASRLIQDAQLLREAVMLRQQREIAEYVRDTIRAEKAAGGPKTPPTESSRACSRSSKTVISSFPRNTRP